MSPNVLVVDGESVFGKSLAGLYRAAGANTAVTVEAGEAKQGAEGKRSQGGLVQGERREGELLRIPWRRASPVSARNVVLQVSTAFDHLDTAVFLFAPRLTRSLLHENSLAELEAAVDDWVRGALLLLREILLLLVKQGGGRMVLARQSPAGSAGLYAPLEAMATAGFMGLARSLALAYEGPPHIYNFSSRSRDEEGFARFVFDTLQAPGESARVRRREFRFHGRHRLRGLLRPGSRTAQGGAAHAP